MFNGLNDIFKLSYRNLLKRKKRTFLTLLGMFIGIAAVVALVSLGQGLQKTINDQFEKIGADKIIIQAKEVTQGLGGAKASGKLLKSDLDVIDNVQGVEVVSGQLFLAAKVEFNDVQRIRYLSSLPNKPRQAELIIQLNTWEVEEGRMLSHDDKGKVIIGYNLAHNNEHGKNINLDNKIKINNQSFKVAGILKKIGDPSADGGVIVSEEDAREILNESEVYSFIIAKSIRNENPETVGERIEKEFRRFRNQKEGKENFNVQTSTELIQSFNTIFNIIQAVFIGIAAISLVVGGIGIMNTMFTAVLERINEIGVMKAIGARNGDISNIFLIESGLLGLVGGLIGIILGIGISKTIEFGVNYAFGSGTLNAIFPAYLLIGAMIFSLVLGTISGILPARKAAKLQPVESLRYE